MEEQQYSGIESAWHHALDNTPRADQTATGHRGRNELSENKNPRISRSGGERGPRDNTKILLHITTP